MRTQLWMLLERSGPRTFEGFVADREDATQRFVVEILLDGRVVRTLPAREYRLEVDRAGLGDGCCGFSFTLSAREFSTHSFVEARLANVGTLVGQPIALAPASDERRGQTSPPSWVDWMGGLRFGGWLVADERSRTEARPVITARLGDELVAETTPSSWKHVIKEDGVPEHAFGFDLYLPERLADGRVHWITVQAGDRELGGSPLGFIAFEDGLSSFLARTPHGEEHDWVRARFLDRMMPMSMPFAAYDSWRDRFPVPPPARNGPSVAVALVGDDDPRTLASLDDQVHRGWTAALIAGVPGELTFAREELRGFLEEHAAEEDFVLFVPSGTILVENALARFSSAIAAHPDALAIYGDVDVLDGSGRPWPLLFPAFDYERLLEQGYCAFLFAARKEVVRRAIENSADDFMQVFFALLREGPIDPARVVHLPGAVGILPPFDREKLAERLARAVRDHLAARGTSASVEAMAASLLPAVHVRREVPFSNSVSIVIPTRNRVDLLRPCLESIGRAETTHVAEVIVVDNDSSDPETLDFLEDEQRSGRSRVLRVPGHFNYSRLNNIAVNSARGRNVCLLNNDVEVISPDWLEEMLGRLEDPDVGAVGALLIWPSGVVQHGGVVLGTHFAADHAFSDRLADDPGYCDLLRVAHQCSAVTAACLLTRKEDYFAVGSLDESFLPVNFNDVDFCLRLRARHKRVVFTPHAKLLHHESVSRGPDKRTNRENRARRELATLRARWLDVLISDPFYSPALALNHFPYAGLAWPPRPMEPRLATSPVPVETLPGF